MKKIWIAILLLVLAGITTLTVYTLNHMDILGSERVIKVKSIEKASTNMTRNELSEIFNIQLNGKRHKLKFNYYVDFEDTTNINLVVYLDGDVLLEKELITNLKEKEIAEVFNNETVDELRIKESNLKIMKSEDQDFILVDIYTNLDHLKEEYYIWSDEGKVLLEDLLVFDNSLDFTYKEDRNIFYDDEQQLLAKIEDNTIYSLELKEKEDSYIFEEYEYKIKDNKMTKELINTYENIKVKKRK